MVGIGGIDIHGFAPDPKGAPGQFMQGPGIHDVHQAMQQTLDGHHLPTLETNDFVGIIRRISHPVYAGYRGHHQDIPAPGHQGGGGS